MTLCGWPDRVNKAKPHHRGNVSAGGSVNVLAAETFPSDTGLVIKSSISAEISEGNHPGSLKKLMTLQDKGLDVLFR